MKFKVGDKVRVLKEGVDWIHEMDKYIGEEGVVRFAYGECLYWDAGKEMTYIGYNLTIDGKDVRHYFCEDSLELAEPTVPVSSSCPRCGKEMEDKVTADYGTIKKCKGCGYC